MKPVIDNRVLEISPAVIANCFIKVMSDALMSDLRAPWTLLGMYERGRRGAKRSRRCSRQVRSRCEGQQAHPLHACCVVSCAAAGTCTGTFVNAIMSATP